MEKEKKKKIEEFVEKFFQKIGVFPIIKKLEKEKDTLSISLEIKEGEFLIGERGKTLQQIQGVLGRILRRILGENFIFNLDINDYKKKKEKHLMEIAQSLADWVALEKKEKELPPMPAYQRRIIHLALAKREDVQTESKGEEPERRVVIKPV